MISMKGWQLFFLKWWRNKTGGSPSNRNVLKIQLKREKTKNLLPHIYYIKRQVLLVAIASTTNLSFYLLFESLKLRGKLSK